MLPINELFFRLANVMADFHWDYGRTMAKLILNHLRLRVKELRGLVVSQFGIVAASLSRHVAA